MYADGYWPYPFPPIAGADDSNEEGTQDPLAGEGSAAQAADKSPKGAADGSQADTSESDAGFAVLVKELRRENQTLRTRANTAESKVTTFEEEKLSDGEKLLKQLETMKSENETLKSQYRDRDLRFAVLSAATKLNVVDPEAAYALLNKEALEFDDSGQPKNVEAAVKALITDKSYLVGKPAQVASGSATNPPKSDKEAQNETNEQRRTRLYSGGKGSIFDPVVAKEAGGGVLFTAPTDATFGSQGVPDDKK
jgi:hypothetical protein